MNNVTDKLKAPAIGLLIAGIVNGLIALLILLGGVIRLTGILGQEDVPTREAEKIGFFIGTFGGYGIALITLLVAPVIIYGAIQMMNGKNHKLSKRAAILAIIPFTACCFLVGVPFGVWALVTLNKPEVVAFFNGEMPPQQYFPPQPPPNW